MNGGGSSHGGGFNNGMNPFPYSNSMHNNMYMPNSNSYRSNDRSSRQVQQQAFNRNNRNIRRGRRLSRRGKLDFFLLYLWFTNDEMVQNCILLLFSRCSSWLFWRRINTRYTLLHYNLSKKKKEFVLDIAASSVFVLLGIGDMKDISDSLEALNKSQSKQGEGFGGFWVFWCSWGFLQKLPNNFGTDSLCMHTVLCIKIWKKVQFFGGGVLSETNSIESLENFLRAIRLHPLSCRPK